MPAQPIIDGPILDHSLADDYHHRWFIVDENGRQLDSGEIATLLAVTLSIAHGCLVLRAPGMLRLDIVMDVIEDDESVRLQVWVSDQLLDVIDEGDLVSAWLSNLLQRQCRLVKVHPDCERPISKQ